MLLIFLSFPFKRNLSTIHFLLNLLYKSEIFHDVPGLKNVFKPYLINDYLKYADNFKRGTRNAAYRLEIQVIVSAILHYTSKKSAFFILL